MQSLLHKTNQPKSTTSTTTTTSIVPHNIQQLLYLPITILLHIFYNITSKIKVQVTTTEQNEILNQVPILQNELQSNIRQTKLDQEQIDSDLKSIKSRLDRLEERRRQRAKLDQLRQEAEAVNDKM